MKTFNIIFVLFILSFPSFSYSKVKDYREIDQKIYSVQNEIRNNLIKALRNAFGVKEISIGLTLNVNKENLYKRVLVLEDKFDELQKIQLPSLAIPAKEQINYTEQRQILKTDIINELSSISLKIFMPYQITDEELFKNRVKNILLEMANITNNIDIQIEMGQTKNVLLDPREDSISNPKIKLDLQQFNFDNILENFTHMGYFLGLFLILFLVVIIYGVRSIHKLRKTLMEKKFDGQLSTDIKLPSETFSFLNENRQGANGPIHQKESSLDEYFDKFERLKSTISNNESIFLEILYISLVLKDNKQLILLLNLSDQTMLQKFYSNLQKKQIEYIDNLLVSQGEQIIRNKRDLLNFIDSLQGLFDLSLIKPENFYSYCLAKIINQMDDETLLSTYNTINEDELIYLLENTQIDRLSYIIHKSRSSWRICSSSSATENAHGFMMKLLEFISKEDDITKKDHPMIKVIGYLSHEAEKLVLNQLNLAPEKSFQNLYSLFFEDIIINIVDFSFEELKDLFAMLTEDQQQKTLKALPDILAERLERSHVEFTKNSFTIKHKLYKVLVNIYESKTGEVFYKTIHDTDIAI